MQYPVIAFIGAGNMSTAIITGLVKSGYPAEKIIVTNPSAEKRNLLSNKFAIGTTESNNQAAKEAEVIVLAVKPLLIKHVCEEIKMSVNQQLIISVAAGKSIASIKRYLDKDPAVIRAMPNTPSLLSEGVTGLFSDSTSSPTNRDFVTNLFENIGKIVWLENEQQIDIVTALSGSGPAYYFYLTEALINAGIELGLDVEMSKILVTQTAVGAIAMLDNKNSQSAAELRKAVTSPNGTTAAAISVFEENKLMQVIAKAICSGTARGRELSKESE